MNLCDLATVKSVLQTFGIAPHKEFGQNFLINRSVVEQIAENCCDNQNGTILEIGPGIGTLTTELAIRHRSVIALEIDRGLIPVLDYTLGEFDNVKVLLQDVMKADLKELLKDAFASGGVSVCANLPYYITTPILMKLLESGLPFDNITVMVQKEVADRLASNPGESDYGSITAAIAYYGTVEKLFTVGAGNFLPPPKVNSSVIRIRLYKEKPYHPKDEKLLFRTIKAAFGQRRKTLSNALSAGFPELSKSEITDWILECGLPADIRGERLSIADFIRLSDLLADR